MQKLIGLLASAALALALVPAIASAQTAGSSLLTVYVQVVNSANLSNHSASDFNVLVAGQSPSPSTFTGSTNGTQVSLDPGTYSVVLGSNTYGYSPSYSQGCNGTIAANQTALCIITLSGQYASYPYPVPYPYPYQTPTLACVPQHQTAGLGQNVSFSTQGGVGGTYNWMTPGHNFPNIGPVLTTSFDSTGSHLVVVTNASQNATCSVEVTNSYVPTNVPTIPTTTVGPGYSNVYPTPILTAQPYPRLPNTGVEPLGAMQLALALTLLAGAGLLIAPYVRKAFSIAVR